MNEDLEIIYVCAVRYALGRRSYVPSTVCDYLMTQKLSKKCMGVIIRDIKECENYGWDCDKKQWMKLLAHLEEKTLQNLK